MYLYDPPEHIAQCELRDRDEWLICKQEFCSPRITGRVHGPIPRDEAPDRRCRECGLFMSDYTDCVCGEIREMSR